VRGNASLAEQIKRVAIKSSGHCNLDCAGKGPDLKVISRLSSEVWGISDMHSRDSSKKSTTFSVATAIPSENNPSALPEQVQSNDCLPTDCFARMRYRSPMSVVPYPAHIHYPSYPSLAPTCNLEEMMEHRSIIRQSTKQNYTHIQSAVEHLVQLEQIRKDAIRRQACLRTEVMNGLLSFAPNPAAARLRLLEELRMQSIDMACKKQNAILFRTGDLGTF